MTPFDQIKSLDHHAYCLVGISGVGMISFLEKEHKIKPKGNPDFFYEKFEVFGIDDSRRIKELHSSKSFTEKGKRVFIIECAGMTHEAQNSLLKIFEEPHEHTYFFILIPSASLLLPTLQSRLSILGRNEEGQEKEAITEAKNFLKLSMKDKITFVDELAKEISDEKAEKSDALAFLATLESVLYEKTDMKKISDGEKRVLMAISKARDYMNDRSPSVKQLLEFVAMSL